MLRGNLCLIRSLILILICIHLDLLNLPASEFYLSLHNIICEPTLIFFSLFFAFNFTLKSSLFVLSNTLTGLLHVYVPFSDYHNVLSVIKIQSQSEILMYGSLECLSQVLLHLTLNAALVFCTNIPI